MFDVGRSMFDVHLFKHFIFPHSTFDIRCWMLDVRCWTFIFFSVSFKHGPDLEAQALKPDEPPGICLAVDIVLLEGGKLLPV